MHMRIYAARSIPGPVVSNLTMPLCTQQGVVRSHLGGLCPGTMYTIRHHSHLICVGETLHIGWHEFTLFLKWNVDTRLFGLVRYTSYHSTLKRT